MREALKGTCGRAARAGSRSGSRQVTRPRPGDSDAGAGWCLVGSASPPVRRLRGRTTAPACVMSGAVPVLVTLVGRARGTLLRLTVAEWSSSVTGRSVQISALRRRARRWGAPGARQWATMSPERRGPGRRHLPDDADLSAGPAHGGSRGVDRQPFHLGGDRRPASLRRGDRTTPGPLWAGGGRVASSRTAPGARGHTGGGSVPSGPHRAAGARAAEAPLDARATGGSCPAGQRMGGKTHE